MQPALKVLQLILPEQYFETAVLETGSASMTGSAPQTYIDPNPTVDRILLELARDDVLVSRKARSVEIFFSRRRDYDALRSSDQDFGDNRLFLSDDGSILLTFLPRMQ
jgi:hypothetical protein